MKKQLPILFFLLCLVFSGAAQNKNQQKEREEILSAMKRATVYMMDRVGYQGAFLWEYSFEHNRYWGEVEARRTMGWTQGGGGTPAMGHILLDAYHATGDEYYYQAASRVADALVRAQLPCGGWNYCFDMAGEGALKEWYGTIRQYKWPAQEFLHYYGNATFDDMASARPCEFILRIYLEKNDPRYKQSLDQAINFVLESQYPIGGWPQRYPLSYEHPYMGIPDYSSFITLNDGAMSGIIDFLLNCYTALGDQRLIDPIYRGMQCVKLLQYPRPLAGWGLQYRPTTLTLATARPFEPAVLASGGTSDGIKMMLQFYRLTGDKRFLEGVPAAFEFLEKIKLDDSVIEQSGRKLSPGDILCPTFIDPVTMEFFFMKRVGNDLWTGGYEKADILLGMNQGYSSVRQIRLAAMKKEYETLLNTPGEKLRAASPLTMVSTGNVSRYVTAYGRAVSHERVQELLRALNGDGYWPAPLNPKKTAQKIDQRPNRPAGLVEQEVAPIEQGIVTETFIGNMAQLIDYLKK